MSRRRGRGREPSAEAAAALVGNAADAGQVRAARQTERDRRRQELRDVAALLETSAGRRFIWRLLEHCRVFESVYAPDEAIRYLAGRQDVGHFVLAELTEASPAALLAILQERQAAAERAARDREVREEESTSTEPEPEMTDATD